MSKAKDYEDVLEAIGILGSRSKINNLLNRVYAHSKDTKLREMVGEVLAKMPRSGINHSVFTLRDSRAVSTKKLEEYCRDILEWDQDIGPVSIK